MQDEEHEPDEEEDPEKPPDPPRKPPPRRAQCPPPRIAAPVPRPTKHLRTSPTQELNQSPASPPTRQTLLHGRGEPTKAVPLAADPGVRMDQEAITIRRTHTPEAAGSSPATGDPAAASRTADEVRQEPTARKELSDPRGRAAECEDGELGWIQGEEGKEGRGGGGRDLRMMRRCGGEGREGGSSSSLADVKGKTRQKPPFPVMRLHSFFTLPRTIRV